jgi:hypothetical protein
VRDQASATPSPEVRRFEKQRLDRIAGEAEDANGHVRLVREHPELERVPGKDVGNERPIEHDVRLGEKRVRGADGTLPEGE